LDKFLFSISKNKQFKPREAKIKLFGLPLIVNFFKNGIVVAFELAHFPGLLIGVHFFYFSLWPTYSSFSPLIFLLGHTLFTFFKFSEFLRNMEPLQHEKDDIFGISIVNHEK